MPDTPSFLGALDPSRDLVVVIMAGGAGTRFWPASTEGRPKQFLPFFGDRSLFQQAYDRVVDLVGPSRILILTQERFVPHVKAQLPALPAENVIGEPMRRDTAAAVCLASALAERRYGDPVLAILTADHLIKPKDAFQKALLSAAKGAATGEALYTFGIEPTYPATGYGYLELGEKLGEDEGTPHFSLKRFVEKPDEETAKRYLETGRFLWNSGMFLWRTSAILEEYARQLTGHLERIRAAVEHDGRPDFDARLKEAFEPLEKTSVDYGILEGARSVRCAKARFSWSDVGGFPALYEHLPKDDGQNAHRGHIAAQGAKDNLVFCEDEGELVALLGVEGLIVVRSGRRTLVVPRERAEEIKKLVESLPEEER